MKVIKRKVDTSPTINTASLPDIIFMLLFFFMTVTVMRINKDELGVALPEVKSLVKLDYNKDFGHLYVGKDLSMLQMNDKFIKLEELKLAVKTLSAHEEVSNYRTKMYVDQETRMSNVNQVKLELRKSEALRIQYVLKEVK